MGLALSGAVKPQLAGERQQGKELSSSPSDFGAFTAKLCGGPRKFLYVTVEPRRVGN
jgi:hypothetical protein